MIRSHRAALPYSGRSEWHNGIINKRAIYKVIEALDGEVAVNWKEF
jgi:hypothetical protein